jgi:hypothetical protein
MTMARSDAADIRSRPVPRSAGTRSRDLAKMLVVASAGAVLVALALVADGRWFDDHFLPSFFLPRRWYALIHATVRWAVVVLGVTLASSAPRIAGRLTRRTLLRAVPALLAAVFALLASEVVLRVVHLRPAEWLFADEEPRRQPDGRLGWTLVPSRTGHGTLGGRTVAYAIDPAGYRVRSDNDPVDVTQPTMLFVGESIMFGEGLSWEESVPAQVGMMMGVQSANLAVHGYSTDQAYLRLAQELPRFRRPIAVVVLFMPALVGRNLDDDRPHLGPGLVWLPARQHGRLLSLAKLIVPYRRTETVERGLRVTHEVLQAAVQLIRARGATPLIVVPQFGVEEPVERTLRRRILDDGSLPYTLVAIDSGWRIAWDRHPNAQAAHAMAAAIAECLRGGRR